MARSSTTARVGLPGPALKHGARSRYTLEKRAAEVREELTELLSRDLPGLTAADAPLVDLAVDVTAQLRLIREYLQRTSGGSLIDLRGRPRSCANLYMSLLRQATTIFDRLGIGPAARAQILSSASGSQGLASQLAARRATLALEAANGVVR